ncbi:MAG: GNAT family N-acetyltransferase [Anaerolineales bacterium]|nr:GNAT family N-acetyltransferase [Anaerolineales bacterium]
MNLIHRPYRNEYDYHKIREFFTQTLLLNGRKQVNWHLVRWDYWRWHVNANIFHLKLEDAIHLWETEDGALVAILNPDSPGEAFFQIHPRHYTKCLVSEMLDVAEENLSVNRSLQIWAHEQDELLQQALIQRGYKKQTTTEHQRWQTLDHEIPNLSLPKGYKLDIIHADSDLPARSWASWRAFHPDEQDDKYQGWEWYFNVQRAPLYRRDLDLVAIAPTGEVASFTTVWWDESTKTGIFEPVGTVPEHQHKGLAKALMTEGLKRLKQLGAVMAYVSSYGKAAHATYESAGFTNYDCSELWERVW